MIVLGIALSVAGFEWRMAHTRKQKVMLEKLVAERTDELKQAYYELQSTQDQLLAAARRAGSPGRYRRGSQYWQCSEQRRHRSNTCVELHFFLRLLFKLIS